MLNFRFGRSFIFIYILSILGVFDTSYLTETHLRGAALVCGAISNLSKCNVVATSSYSAIYGIPVSLLGLLFYIAIMLGVGIYYARSRNLTLLHWLIVFTGAGVLFSLYLLYIQAFVLKAFCQYCLASDLLTLMIFTILIVRYKRDSKSPRPTFSTDKGN